MTAVIEISMDTVSYWQDDQSESIIAANYADVWGRTYEWTSEIRTENKHSVA